MEFPVPPGRGGVFLPLGGVAVKVQGPRANLVDSHWLRVVPLWGQQIMGGRCKPVPDSFPFFC